MDTRLQKIGLLGMILLSRPLISSGFFPSAGVNAQRLLLTSVALAEKKRKRNRIACRKLKYRKISLPPNKKR